MKNLLAFIFLFTLLIVFALGYIGFIPYLSNFIGPKPKDLEIKFTQKDFDNGFKKSGVKLDAINKKVDVKDSLVLIGSHEVKDSFSSEEITAAAQKRKWVHWPFDQVQVRFNKDGSAEASGLIKINKLFSYLSTLGVSTNDLQKAINKFKIPMTNLPFYIKATGSVKDNNVDCKILQFNLGRIPVPMNYITKYSPAANWFLEKNLLGNRPSYDIKSLTINNGQLLFDGKLPDIEATLDK